MWEQVKMPNRHFLRSDIFTFVIVYYFYFLCFGSRRNEGNSLLGREGGEVRSLLLARKVSRQKRKNDILRQYNDKIIMYSDRFRYHLIISETWKKVQHSEKDIRISHNLLSPPPSLSKDYCIHSRGAKTQKKEIIPYPRCGFGACLRCGRAF